MSKVKEYLRESKTKYMYFLLVLIIIIIILILSGVFTTQPRKQLDDIELVSNSAEQIEFSANSFRFGSVQEATLTPKKVIHLAGVLNATLHPNQEIPTTDSLTLLVFVNGVLQRQFQTTAHFDSIEDRMVSIPVDFDAPQHANVHFAWKHNDTFSIPHQSLGTVHVSQQK